jgi:hypothetical protein
LHAAQRILVLRRFITAVIDDIPEKNWTSLSTLIQLLLPFETATNAVQSDSANLFTVYSSFVNILQGLNDISNSDDSLNFEEIHNIIVKYRMNYINTDVIICSAVFLFDVSHKNIFTPEQRLHANEWFIDFSMVYLDKYYPSIKTSRAVMARSLGNFLSRTGILILCKNQLMILQMITVQLMYAQYGICI